ncbi:MAG: hypothetical protein II581_03650, partial [Oscillospiraceae bacterium]|nr:hypothetical protein [Oscillospiraceae bacterium]
RKNWTKFFNLKYGKDIIRNIALLPFIYFSDFRDLHLATSHLKRNFKKVWDAEPTYIFNATKSKYRSTTDVSHWLIKQWYICSGEFSPRSTKWGRRFELGSDHDIESYILGHKGKIVCTDAEPADQRHDDLEKSEHAGNGAHSAGGHFRFIQTVGQRDRKGVHRQADTEKHAVDKKKKVPFHFWQGLFSSVVSVKIASL